MTDRAQLRADSRAAVEDNAAKATMAKEAIVIKGIESLTDGTLPDTVKDNVLDQFAEILRKVELTTFANPAALLGSSIVQIATGSAQPAAVTAASSTSSTEADKLRKLADQLGEADTEVALDKLLKLTKGLETLNQPQVAKSLDLAGRIFDQSLANALEVAPGGAKLQIEEDHKLVSDQLTTANTELAKLRPVAKWAKPYVEELDKAPNATERGARELLMLEGAKGKTPKVADPVVVKERDAYKAVVDYVHANAKQGNTTTGGKGSMIVQKLNEAPDPVKTVFAGKFKA